MVAVLATRVMVIATVLFALVAGIAGVNQHALSVLRTTFCLKPSWP